MHLNGSNGGNRRPALTVDGLESKNKGMARLVAPLLMLLQTVAAMAPASGVEVCLGTPGGRPAAPAESSCGCGHHGEPLSAGVANPEGSDRKGEREAPFDSNTCVDVELIALEALPADRDSDARVEHQGVVLDLELSSQQPLVELAPRRARRRAPPRAAPPAPCAALRHRETVQILR